MPPNLKRRLLSQGSKEVLIKAIALAIPIFAMSCFKLPTTLYSEIESLIANFWWRQNESEKKIHWIGWENMCMAKFKGDLGFRKLSTFNFALLAKQGWRIIQDEQSLPHRIYKARYFLSCSFLESKLGLNPSYTW